jgi:hypothetical protein
MAEKQERGIPGIPRPGESQEDFLMRMDEEETWDRITEGGYGSG